MPSHVLNPDEKRTLYRRGCPREMWAAFKLHLFVTRVGLISESGLHLRVQVIDGKPWLALIDVCKHLGLNNRPDGTVNTTAAARRLEDDERGQFEIATSGGPQRATMISESGLYKLIMRSDKPAAKPFQDWVTKTVLPAIRKDGAYIAGEEKLASGEMSEDEFILKAMTIVQGKVERLRAENAEMAAAG